MSLIQSKFVHQPALKSPPADNSPLPLVRYTFEFYSDIRRATERLYERNGDVVQTGFGPLKVINLFGPDANQFVLQNRDGIFSSHFGWDWVIDRVFPGAIMAMDGDEHRYQRRIMQQAFKKHALESYLRVMGPEIERAVSRWKPGNAFPVYAYMKRMTLDLAASVFMGADLGKNTKKMNKAFIDAVEASIAPIRFAIPGSRMWRGVRGRHFLVNQFKSLLPQKRALETPDFFSQFCHATSEEGERFNDAEIIDHMIFLMMAAHDTTTSTLSTIFYALAKNPDWQATLREEVFKLNKAFLDYDDLEKLPLMELVIKEALRMYPPLPTMPRRAMRPAEFEGYRIPRFALVSVSPIHTHYMKSIWTDPDKFDPERFAPGREEHKQHMFSWVPFGGGAHMCIGQHFAMLQVKSVLHQVLKRFRWDVPSDYEMPFQLVPIAKPKDGLPVKLMRF